MSDSDLTRARLSSIGWMVQRVATTAEREMAARLAPHGLTVLQFAVLVAVLELPGASQAEIGGRFGQPAYAISRALDALEAAGLVERRQDAQSRRINGVHPTAKARALAPRLRAIVAETNTALTAPLSPQERQALAGLLARLLPSEDRH
jgi:DNA-binding MarR family transcriptional regulator